MKRKIYIVCLAVIFTIIYVYNRDIMFYNNDFTDTNVISTIVPVLLMFFFSLMPIVFSMTMLPSSKVTRSFKRLMIFIYLISIFWSLQYPLTSREEYITMILPLLLFYFMSLSSCYLKNEKTIIWGISCVVILLSVYYVNGYTENLLGSINATTASYHILFFLPFLLCHKNKLLRILFSVMIFVITMVSLKRGGLLASAAAILVYLYVSEFSLKGRRINFAGIIVASIAILVVSYLYLVIDENLLGGIVTSRMDSIGETGGSGRVDVYSGYLKFIGNDNLVNYLIGHGWWGSIRDSSVGVTCHNDFLECFVDFGVFGFIFYLTFIISLFKLCVKMIKVRHEYAPAMAASLAIFFVNSMVSHIFIYSKFLMTLALFWGFIVSVTRDLKYQNINNNRANENRTVNIPCSM